MSWPPPPLLPPGESPKPMALERSWWKRLFVVPDSPQSVEEVSAWWEARRLTYNLLVFGMGVPSFCLYLFFLNTSGLLPPGEDAVEPFALILAPVMVPIAVNICYTLGALAELGWRGLTGDFSRKSGRVLMRLGVGLSMFIVWFPSVVWGLLWFRHIVLKL